MKIINIIIKKYLFFASFFTILIIFNSSKVLANGEILPSIGYIDSPIYGSEIKGSVDIRGWFLDGSGVSKIEVLVDGKSMGSAQYGSPRVDVEKAFPEYQNAHSGYQFTLNTKTLTNGQHSITVRETGNNGTTKELDKLVVNIQNLPTIGTIDTPKNGSEIKGSVDFSGWFLDVSGVSKLEVLIDGKSVGLAQYGSSRVDVEKAYPDYENAHSGYQFTLNTKTLTNGQHSLTVRETGINGATKELDNLLVNVQNLPAKGFIDTPMNGSVIKDSIDVRGWFLDGSGVSKVEVLIDGKSMGSAQYGSPRADVEKAFPEYQNANSGYQFTLNTKTLTNGQHSLVVREIGNNGATTVLENLVVNVQNVPAKGFIDTPTNGTDTKGVVDVRGWFLDVSGVSKLEVLVDGKSMGSAQYGSPRVDVEKAYPEYQNANSGYQFTLNTKTLINGQHSLTVRETGNNGATSVLENLVVNVQNIPAKGFIDTPINRTEIKGSVDVRGWFLDVSGVSKLEVLIDGKSMGSAQYGSPRVDVEKAFPEYQNANSGYQFTLNTKAMTNGQHLLTVRETGNNGATKELDNLVVNVQNLPTIGTIDTPTNGSEIKGSVDVSGWILDVSGVSKLEVLIDGKSMGSAQYGSPRVDVEKAYPDYENAHSGYQFTLNTKTLTNGQHSLAVRETGNNGATKELNNLVLNVQNLPAKGFIDTPTNGSVIKGSIDVRGWFLDGSGVSKVEVLVDGKSMGSAQYGSPRADVEKAFPEYQNANSGYQFTFNSQQVSNGQHTLTIVETGINGSTSTLNIQLIVDNGNPYSLLDLRKPANITANDIVNFFSQSKHPDSPLKNYAQTFIDAQNKYGVNAQYLVAHAIWETAWGGKISNLRTYKHNLFGYSAFDVCPFTCGYYFPSDEQSIIFEAYIVRKEYLDTTGSHYHGPNLKGMNIDYASDSNWENGISSIMQSIKPYDEGYYSQSSILPSSSLEGSYGSIIPPDQPYPKDIIINYQNTYATVITNGLRLRTIPYISSTILKSLDVGKEIMVLGYNTDVKYVPGADYPYDNRWYRVLVDGQEGWVYGGGIAFK